MSTSPVFTNPDTVHPPLGLYSHCVAVPRDAELLYVSGQLGVRPDGSVGSTVAEQADQAFENLVAVLRGGGMGPENIVKLTTYIVAGHDGDGVRAARLKHLGDLRPASTAVWVAGLVRPEWFVEVDAVAAKV